MKVLLSIKMKHTAKQTIIYNDYRVVFAFIALEKSKQICFFKIYLPCLKLVLVKLCSSV